MYLHPGILTGSTLGCTSVPKIIGSLRTLLPTYGVHSPTAGPVLPENQPMRTSAAMITVALSAGLAPAAVKTQSVDYSHDGVALKGYLAYDDAAPGQRPGVLVVHEWWGLNDYARKRAEMLAEMGYVAFAVDMYGGG